MEKVAKQSRKRTVPGPDAKKGVSVRFDKNEIDRLRQEAGLGGLSELIRKRALGRPEINYRELARVAALHRVGRALIELARRADISDGNRALIREVIAEARVAVRDIAATIP